MTREQLLSAVDKEIDLANDAQKQIGLTKWGGLAALGALSVILARLWETGGIDVAKSLSIFIGVSLVADSLLTLLRNVGVRNEATLSHWYDPPFHLADEPPLAAILHRAILIGAIFWSTSYSSRILSVFTILFLAYSLLFFILYLLIGVRPPLTSSDPHRKTLQDIGFVYAVKHEHLSRRFIEPMVGLILGIWHCAIVGIPQQGMPVAFVKLGILLFLFLSLGAHLVRRSGRPRVDALHLLRRLVVLGDMSLSDGKLAFESLLAGMFYAPSFIMKCREICAASNTILKQLNTDTSQEESAPEKRQLQWFAQNLESELKNELNMIRMGLSINVVNRPTSVLNVTGPFHEAEQALKRLSQTLNEKDKRNKRFDNNEE